MPLWAPAVVGDVCRLYCVGPLWSRRSDRREGAEREEGAERGQLEERGEKDEGEPMSHEKDNTIGKR